MKRAVPKLACVISLFCPVASRASVQHSAAVAGVIRDVHGTPQMGALVELLSGNTVVARTYTDDHGRYLLEARQPGHYGLRASSTLAVPTVRWNLSLPSGVQVFANLTMTAIYEVGIWFPAEQRSRNEPANDWRWTLRSSANRPILRVHGGDSSDGVALSRSSETDPSQQQVQLASYTQSGAFGRGGLHQSLSINEARSLPSLGLSVTNLLLDVGGTQAGSPGPDVKLQSGISLGSEPGSTTKLEAAFVSAPSVTSPGAKGMQIFSLQSEKQLLLGQAVLLDVGNVLVTERLNGERSASRPHLQLLLSPAAGYVVMYRLATDPEAQAGESVGNANLSDVLADAEGHPIIPRQLHQEMALSHTTGPDSETLAVYRDHLAEEGLNGVGMLTVAEVRGLSILADSESGNYRFAVPGYTGRGVTASWTHRFGPDTSATATAEYGTALLSSGPMLHLDQVRSEARPHGAATLTARVQEKSAKTGTSLRAQYRWQPSRTLDCVDPYNADHAAFLSLSVQQRLWAHGQLHSLEAVVDAKNLLGQGYQPVLGPNGEILFLAPEPRMLQAGLSFTF